MITGDIKTDQRLLNLAACGPLVVDGIEGRKTKAATAAWMDQHAAIRADCGELDSRSEKNLASVLPALARAARAIIPAIQKNLPAGWAVKIICGSRSFAEQDALYQQGRTRPGAIVTNTRGGGSFHNFGLAFDIGIFSSAGQYVTDDAVYRNAVAGITLPENITWGGTWKSFPDSPHFQLSIPGLPSLSAVRLRAEGRV